MVRSRTAALLGCASLLLYGGTAWATTGPSDAAERQGPSSSQPPYLVGTERGVSATSVVTVGDEVGGYRMVGLADGLGAYDNHDGTFTLLANHELSAGLGVARDHGTTGAFVSKWTIRKGSLRVVAGEDLIQRVRQWDGTAWVDVTTEFSRFCSADLAQRSAFADRRTRTGTWHRLFTNGEESGAEGRAVATVVDGPDAGSAYVLPGLGRASWENIVAMPGAGRRTVVVGLDDSGGGQVYVYVGEKQRTGNDVERAGLTGGTLYGVRIDGVDAESDATTVPADGAAFELVEIPGAATMTGAELETTSSLLGISKLNRPEDGAWDPSHRGGFYFNTTASFTGISRLWHLDFSDPRNPLAGGSARVVVQSPAYDASLPVSEQAGPRMMDNLTVDRRGRVLVQEDPGNQAYLAGVFLVDPSLGTATRIAQHRPSLFTPGSPSFLTQDEESSGIVPVPFLGQNAFLLTVQAHYATGDPETVEDGQLELLTVPRSHRH